MKYFALLSFLFFIGVQAYAQQNSERLLYIEKAEKYRKMKGSGSALTVTGAGLVVIGIVTIANTIKNNANGYGTTQTTANGGTATGLGIYVLGIGCLGAGIPLWIVGAHSQHKYERKLGSMYVGFNASPQNTGLKLTYRF